MTFMRLLRGAKSRKRAFTGWREAAKFLPSNSGSYGVFANRQSMPGLTRRQPADFSESAWRSTARCLTLGVGHPFRQMERSMKRMRYQQGTLRLEQRANGNRVWEYRWYETQIDGTRRRRSAMIGTFQEFPSESSAQKAVAALRANVNAE